MNETDTVIDMILIFLFIVPIGVFMWTVLFIVLKEIFHKRKK